MTAIVSFFQSRLVAGLLASTAALLLCLIWHPVWLAPVLVIALTAVWIVESRRVPPVVPAEAAV
ncbi:MAG TPA: methyl-accepting chemotaxis protein, partial [Dyella sp.]|nr:methyl-accepting chemotaxis protein [Dyella sp.]